MRDKIKIKTSKIIEDDNRNLPPNLEENEFKFTLRSSNQRLKPLPPNWNNRALYYF